MRSVIDREGRLFGIINVIDALVLAVVLSLAPALYYGYRLVHQPLPPPAPAPEPPPPVWVTARALMVGMSCEALALVSPGDVEMDPAAGGGERVRVLAVGPLNWGEATRPVIVALRCVQEGSRLLLYKERPLKVGSRLVLESEEWDGVALIQEWHLGETDPGWGVSFVRPGHVESVQLEWVQVKLMIQDLLPELAGVIAVGDRVVAAGASQEARVVAVQDPVPGAIPGRMTVQCDIQMECARSGGERLFRQSPVKIGRMFRVETDRYSLEGVIVQITPVAQPLPVEGAGA